MIKTSKSLTSYSFLEIYSERERKIAAFIRAGLIFDFFEDENIFGCEKINLYLGEDKMVLLKLFL